MFDYVVDCIARSVHIVTNLLCDIIHGDAVDQLFTTFGGESHSLCGTWTGPAGTASRAVSRPARSFKPVLACNPGAFACRAQHRANRSRPGRPAPDHQGYPCADRNANERGGEQVKLVFALLVEISFCF